MLDYEVLFLVQERAKWAAPEVKWYPLFGGIARAELKQAKKGKRKINFTTKNVFFYERAPYEAKALISF